MLYKELTGKMLEACFEVSNELGSGFLESVYQSALVIALKQKGLSVQAQTPLSVRFRGEQVGQFFCRHSGGKQSICRTEGRECINRGTPSTSAQSPKRQW